MEKQQLLEMLSQSQNAVLAEIKEKKSDLVQEHMHDSALVTTWQGMQLTKDMFIQGFIKNPDIRMQSFSADDYQLIYSDENVAVLGYRERLEISGQPAVSLRVVMVYANIKGTWKVVSVQSSPITA